MGIGKTNAGIGGGSGGTLTVIAPAGVTVTAAKDGKSKTKVAGTDGVAVFKGLESGTWTLTATDGDQTATGSVMITTDYNVTISFNTIPEFTYTGDYEIVDDEDNPITESQDNWKIRFLTSGTLTFTNLNGAQDGIDVFLVGGGGGSKWTSSGAGGGGGGYTATIQITPVAGTPYSVEIGAGGSGSAGGISGAFGATVNGGNANSGTTGGAGGSGGGGYKHAQSTGSCAGGSDGSDGVSGGGYGGAGGKGQGTTTREFGETSGKLYAGGGGGAPASGTTTGGSGGGGNSGTNGTQNTGGGSGGKINGTTVGGSGVVIIRNTRRA